jgi:hypothetical protein
VFSKDLSATQNSLVIATVLLAAAVADARPARPFYQATRALTMGDAYTAVGTDFEAVYYNPAGLARRTKPRLKLIDIEGNVSQSFASMASGGYTSFMSMQKILEKTAETPGQPYGVGMSFLPQFLVRNFSVGVLFRGQSEATYNATTDTTNMYSYADLGAYVHYGVALGGGIFKLGVGAKILNRAELDRDYTDAQVSTGNLRFLEQWQEGLGVGFDAGALLTLPVASLPTFGVAVQDVGNTQFKDRRLLFTSDAAPAGAPQKIPQVINAGYSMIFKQGRGVRSVIAIDYKDVTRVDGDVADHLHAGFELNYLNMLYLRAGVNQGRYWTAGLGLHLGGTGLEFGSYGENLADRGEARVSDRKYSIRYLLAF